MSSAFCSTFSPHRRAVAGALVAAVAGACVPAAFAQSAVTSPPSLLPGDAIVVSGSKLNCVVSLASEASTQPTTLVCGEGPTGAPSPGTYAFAIADGGALILKSSSAGKPELLVKEPQPARVPGEFQAAKKKPARLTKVAIGKEFDVAGTDILCSATRDDGVPAITCGLLGAAKTDFEVGSVIALISSKGVLLSKLVSKDKVETLKAIAQP